MSTPAEPPTTWVLGDHDPGRTPAEPPTTWVLETMTPAELRSLVRRQKESLTRWEERGREWDRMAGRIGYTEFESEARYVTRLLRAGLRADAALDLGHKLAQSETGDKDTVTAVLPFGITVELVRDQVWLNQWTGE